MSGNILIWIVQTPPVFEKGLRTPASKFFNHIGRYPGDEIECCPTNSETMTRDTWVILPSSPQNLIDATYKFRTGQGNDIVIGVAVGSNGVADIQFVLDEMFVDSVYGIQRSLLTWDPDIVASGLLGFGPGQMEIAGPVLSGRFCYVGKCSVAERVEF